MKNGISKLLLAMTIAAACGNAFADTRVNVAHLAPFANTVAGTAVSVSVNGTQVLPNVDFNQVSGYLTLTTGNTAPGNTTLQVFAPPTATTAAIAATPNLAANTDYTVAAIGDGTNQPLALLPLVDDNNAPSAGNIKLRVVHTAPFANTLAATAVSIRTQSGTVLDGLSNVEFGQSSGYFELPAGTYNLKISTPDGTTTLIDPAPVTLPAGTIATLFAVGDGTHLPLGVTAVFGDGSEAVLPLQTATVSQLPTLGQFGLALLVLGVAVFASRRLRFG